MKLQPLFPPHIRGFDTAVTFVVDWTEMMVGVMWYRIDDGLTAGRASHPLAEIPGLLRMDGSPPL